MPLPKDPRKRRAILWLAALDFGTALLAWAVFYAYRYADLGFGPAAQAWLRAPARDYVLGLLIVPFFWLAVYLFSGAYFDLYRKSRLNEVNRTLISCAVGGLILANIVFPNDANDYTYFMRITARYLLLHTALTLAARMALLNGVKRRLLRGRVGFNTLLVGDAREAAKLYQQLRDSPVSLGNVFKGFVQACETERKVAGLPALGQLHALEEIIDRHQIEEVIIAVPSTEHHLIEDILTRLSYRPVVVKVQGSLYDIISGSVKTSNVYDALLIHIHPDLMPGWQRVWKRAIDIVASLTALLILSPLYLFAALRVRLSSPGPIFYRQVRIGRYGRPFTILKFRSMYVDAEAQGPALSSTADQRVTPWGRVMRKWRIDETPQFWNILRGDMSLVGPRPEREHFIRLIAARHPHYRYLHKVKPGLTSWGMVKYGYAENVEQMIERMKYDLLYIENCSLALDIKIMAYTIMVIVQGRGK